MPKGITATECKKLVKEALKKFGEYSYLDKGPREVMDLKAIATRMKQMDVSKVADTLYVVRRGDTGFYKEFVAGMLQHVDGDPFFEPLFEDKRINDLY